MSSYSSWNSTQNYAKKEDNGSVRPAEASPNSSSGDRPVTTPEAAQTATRGLRSLYACSGQHHHGKSRCLQRLPLAAAAVRVECCSARDWIREVAAQTASVDKSLDAGSTEILPSISRKESSLAAKANKTSFGRAIWALRTASKTTTPLPAVLKGEVFNAIASLIGSFIANVHGKKPEREDEVEETSKTPTPSLNWIN